MEQKTSKLGIWVVVAWALPTFAQSLIHGPAGNVLQAIYSKYFGLSLTTIAGVLFAVRLSDLIIDPVIGYASDRYRVRFGSRKPWLVIGSLVAVVACWFLYAPTPPVDMQYFLTWFFLAYLGWTLSEIPYVAWMAEITQDYNDRTRLASWRSIFLYAGAGAFFGIPFLPFLSSTEFTPEALRWCALLAAVALPATVWIAVSNVPDGVVSAPTTGTGIRNVWPAIVGNRPLLQFTLMFALNGLGSGMSLAMLYFYFDNYMHQAAAFPRLMLLSLPAGILATPVWSYLCQLLGKQQAWTLGTLLGVVALLTFPFVPQNADSSFHLGAALLFLISSFAVVYVASPAVLADVVDYGKLRFGEDHAGTYFAFFTIINKAAAGLGGALGFGIAGLLGFDPAAKEMTEVAKLALLATFCGIPALMNALSLPLIWYFPIDQKQQRLIVQQLEERKQRDTNTSPAITAT